MPVLRRKIHPGLGVCLGILVALCVAVSALAVAAKELPLHTLNLPPGFSISLYADNVPNARAMALSPSGVVFVGSRRAGRVYAVVDRDGDHKAEAVIPIAHELNLPTGVAFRDGSLYVAAVSRILRYDDIEARLERPPRPSVVIDTLPNDRHHGWKFIAFGPDDLLYVPVGAPCNVCERNDDPALRHHPAYASGRNAAGTLCPRGAQLGGIRLAPGNRRALVHRQWPRHAGRQSSFGTNSITPRAPGCTSAFPTVTRAEFPTRYTAA